MIIFLCKNSLRELHYIFRMSHNSEELNVDIIYGKLHVQMSVQWA
jgi:hypothetical protein